MNKLCERARSERAWKLFPFSHSKTAISFNILLVLLILYLRNMHIFSGLKLHLHIHTINAVPCYYLWYGVVYKRQLYVYRQNTNIEKIYVYAMRASELRKFSRIFTF